MINNKIMNWLHFYCLLQAANTGIGFDGDCTFAQSLVFLFAQKFKSILVASISTAPRYNK